MRPLVDLVRDALAFGTDIRFLTPSPEVAALGPAVLARATALYAAHLAAVAPFTIGPLPVARVEAHVSALTVLRRLGFALPDPSITAVPSPGPLRPSPVRVAPAVPIAPPSMGGAPPLPPVTPESARWAAACSTAATASVEAIRTDATAKIRLRDLASAYGVRPSSDDPYNGLTEILAAPLHAAYWQHPHAGLSQTVECLVQQPHQSAARALEWHLRWLATWGDDPARPSPWWPVLQLWNLGLWPIPAQDGALLLLAAPIVEGRLVPDPTHAAMPWPTLGTRMSPGGSEAWAEFDRHCGAITQAGLGPIPGRYDVIRGNPPGMPFPR